MDNNRSEQCRLTFLTFLGMFARSFFIQGSFSFKYRQNTGFAFCMEPAGRCLWKDSVEYRSFLRRHMEYYNGNPFMITLVLGAVARLEEKLKNGEISETEIASFKKAVGAATGAIGDRFFWATLRPFALVAGLTAAMFSGVFAFATVLIVFNIPNLVLRWYWLKRGYSLGTAVVTEIQNRNILGALRIMENVVAALIGFITVDLVVAGEGFKGWTLPGGTALFILSFVLYKRNATVQTVLMMSLAIVLAIGIIAFIL